MIGSARILPVASLFAHPRFRSVYRLPCATWIHSPRFSSFADVAPALDRGPRPCRRRHAAPRAAPARRPGRGRGQPAVGRGQRRPGGAASTTSRRCAAGRSPIRSCRARCGSPRALRRAGRPLAARAPPGARQAARPRRVGGWSPPPSWAGSPGRLSRVDVLAGLVAGNDRTPPLLLAADRARGTAHAAPVRRPGRCRGPRRRPADSDQPRPRPARPGRGRGGPPGPGAGIRRFGRRLRHRHPRRGPLMAAPLRRRGHRRRPTRSPRSATTSWRPYDRPSY